MNKSDSVSERLEREKSFHDDRFQEEQDPRSKSVGVSMTRIATQAALNKTYDAIRRNSAGKRVLDYGCAKGETSRILAKYGAEYINAIDISTVAIEQAKQIADQAGITNATFQAMNAEVLEFSDQSFDLVCGFGILHHLDLDKAYSEIARVMKPTGIAVFLEPLGHNPGINLFRKLSPALRTPDEHPLLMKDIKLCKKYFGEIRPTYVNCLTLFCLPFLRIPGSKVAFAALGYLDSWMFTLLPFTRRFAWNVVLEFASPRRAL